MCSPESYKYKLGLPILQKNKKEIIVDLFNDAKRQQDYLFKLERHLQQNCLQT